MVERGDDVLSRMRYEGRMFLSEPLEWFLFVGSRLVIAALTVAAFALCIAALMRAGAVDVWSVPPMIYLYSTLAGGNVTLVTIVLSINQLVLSQEFNAPENLYENMEGVETYRRRVEETTQRRGMPVDPGDFLRVLVEGMQVNAQRLGGAVRGSGDDQLVDSIDSVVSVLTSHAEDVTSRLENTPSDIFSTLSLVLNRNYSRPLAEIHRIETEHEDELSLAVREVFDETTSSIKQLDIARQYFKSIYVQSELARLSRRLLYVGVPAVGSALLMLLVYSGVDGTASALELLPAYVFLTVTLGFSPLAVLLAVVLRAATVAQRTVAVTPFTTPDQKPLSEMEDIE